MLFKCDHAPRPPAFTIITINHDQFALSTLSAEELKSEDPPSLPLPSPPGSLAEELAEANEAISKLNLPCE